jgi:cytochrome c-type biogenesis protein CcmH/NrfG
MNLLQLLAELLGYARKLLPLMELYASRRTAPIHDSAAQEFQQSVVEMQRENRRDLLELKSSFEAIQQRLKVLDDQAVAGQQELARIAHRQQGIAVAVVVSAIASIAAMILGIIVAVRR